MEPTFFATPAELRAWLEEHHATAPELWVGLHKKGSGKPSVTWPEAVAEALCFGWIDGVRRSVDHDAYAIRFMPRRAGSTWSALNVATAERLVREGRMRPAGLAAFAERQEDRSGLYSYEQRDSARLDEAAERRFRADEAAWEFFRSQPPGYRRAAVWWVVSAKRQETRDRRLATLIEDSRHGRTDKPLTRRPTAG
jgi:uncharacterized protein YdeI (YjbR/CyaY-like superfamily)